MCRHPSRKLSGSILLIDQTPTNPSDPIACRVAAARREGQGRRPVSRVADTISIIAGQENIGGRRSLALGLGEHGGRLMAVRDGGIHALIPTFAVMLVICAISVLSPSTALADPQVKETTTRATKSASSDPWGEHIAEAAKRFSIPERWIRSVMQVESAGDPSAISPKGATGPMQIMPGTWEELRARHRLGSDPFDPRDNILAGAAYLAELYDLYGSPGFLAAYNAGPGRYQAHLVSDVPLPVETADYLVKIVPMIDPDAAIGAGATVRPSSAQWTAAPLFVIRPIADVGDGHSVDDLPSRLPKITDLSALESLSQALFARRAVAREVSP